MDRPRDVGLVDNGVNVARFGVLARWLAALVLVCRHVVTIGTDPRSSLLNRSWACSHRDGSRVRFAFVRFSAIDLTGIALETVVLASGPARRPGAGPPRKLLTVLGIYAGTVLRFAGDRAWWFRAAADR